MTFFNFFKSSLFVLITFTSLLSSSVQQSKSSTQWTGYDDDDTEFWNAVAASSDEASLKARSGSEAPDSIKKQKGLEEDSEFWAAVAAEADKASLKSQSMSTFSTVNPSSAQKNDNNPKKRISDGTSIESAKKAHIAKAVSSVSSTSNASTSTKGITRTQAAPSSDPLDSKRSTLSADVIQFKRIQGRNDHIHHLIDMIESAEESIQIFSYTLNFLPQEIFVALRDAAERGIDIDLNVNKVMRQYTHDTLVELGICISPDRKTHTKFAIVDDATAIVGSFNFLDKEHFFNEEDDNGESSFMISTSSDLVDRLRRRIHVDKTSYGCGRSQLPSPLEARLHNDSKLYLLTNLDHHEDFFKSMMRNANEKVIFYSPFVLFPNAVKRLQTINENLKPTVSLEIRVNANQINKLHGAFKKFPNLKRRTTITTGDFHRKSLIVDPGSGNPTICEGSFNWLCASTADSSGGHNQETSVILMGPLAIPHLQADELGKK